MTEEGWTTSQLGIITGIFFWVYAVGQVINGRLSDILGSKKLIVSASVLTGVINIIIGFQNNLTVIAILWGINGIFQSVIWTPGVAALNNWWPGNKLGFATGFAHAFNGLGQGVCALVVSLAFYIIPEYGWKSAFWIPAILPIIAVIPFMIFAKQQPEEIGLRPYTEIDEQKAKREEELKKIKNQRGKIYPYMFLLKMPAFLPWLIMAFFIGIVRYGLLTWIPYYYVDNYGETITSSLSSTFIVPLGMAVGTLVIPWLTDIFCPDNRFMAVIFSGVAATVIVVLFFMVEPGIVAKFLLFFAGFFIYAMNGLMWTFASDVGGRIFSGTASGLLNFASYLGAGCQSAVFGFVLARSNWNSVFLTMAICLVVIVILAVARHKA
ncbi:MAG: MFS transporter [Clostridia bacterium]|nr:MFS transporter [Clostridia bacterium]